MYKSYDYRSQLSSLSSSKLIERIKVTFYSDVCDVLRKFNLSGSDIIVLSEQGVPLNIVNELDKLKLKRFQAFLLTVNTDPHKLLYYQVNNICRIDKMAALPDNSDNTDQEVAECSSGSHRKQSESEYEYMYQSPPKVNYNNSTLSTRSGTSGTSEPGSMLYLQLPRMSTSPPLDNDGYLEPVKGKLVGKCIIETHRFYRQVDRKLGKKLLECTRVGTYLLRPSGESTFLAVLMINGNLKMQNIPIWFNKFSEKFYLNTSSELGEPTMFGSIDELLKYYTTNDFNGDKLLADNEESLPVITIRNKQV